MHHSVLNTSLFDNPSEFARSTSDAARRAPREKGNSISCISAREGGFRCVEKRTDDRGCRSCAAAAKLGAASGASSAPT